MKRLRLWALLALFLVTPALAQLAPVRIQPITPPPAMQQPDNSELQANLMTAEEARTKIAQLNREKRELNARLTEALATIEQMTSRTGSLVRAYCESKTLSRNTAGATENCADSGYVCGEVEGTCKRQCSVSFDCATGYTCMPDGRCVKGGA